METLGAQALNSNAATSTAPVAHALTDSTVCFLSGEADASLTFREPGEHTEARETQAEQTERVG
jgi:hypothetical protein